MAIEFDYDSPSIPDKAVADVVADISSRGQLPPLSDEEREQRRIANELYRWECQQREEERAFEYQQRQAEAESAARHEAALELAEANRKARLERQAQIDKAVREREISDLHFKARRAELWQSNVEHAARTALVQRQRQTLMGELEKMLTPPSPPPEPEREIVYVSEDEGSPDLGDPDFNPKLWMQKSRSWF
jgi:hypothetical protein